MSLVAVCTNPAILPDAPLSSCPAVDQILVPFAELTGSTLQQGDIAALMSAALLTFALAWGLKRVIRSTWR